MEKMCQLTWGTGTRQAAYTRTPWGNPPSRGISATRGITDGKLQISDADVVRRMVEATGGLPQVPPNEPPLPPKTPVDEAEFLLQVASEVEHGLLVQYLYAAYSTTDDTTVPPEAPVVTVPPTAPEGWQTRLVKIAIQEMDHLLNVQNMLLALKRRPYFGRGNFPPAPERLPFYPFPFRFEPLSIMSLGKYVAAESPTDMLETVDLSKLTDNQRMWMPRAIAAGEAGAMQPINHVGVLYATLYWMFQDDDTPVAPWTLPKDVFEGKVRHVSDGDLVPAPTVIERQGTAEEFIGIAGPEPPTPPPPAPDPSLHRVVWTVKTRADVRSAIAQIAEQGEGTQVESDSHFVEFLQLFGEFVTKFDAGTVIPVTQVPTNPNTANDPATEAGRITHPITLLWAQLFNSRYHILLSELALALSETAAENLSDGTSEGRAARQALIANAINREMKGAFAIRGLAKKLATLPLKADGTGLAGAPFEMPAAPLPTKPEEHRDLLVTQLSQSAAIIDQLVGLTGADALPLATQKSLKLIKKFDADFSTDVALMKFTS